MVASGGDLPHTPEPGGTPEPKKRAADGFDGRVQARRAFGGRFGRGMCPQGHWGER